MEYNNIYSCKKNTPLYILEKYINIPVFKHTYNGGVKYTKNIRGFDPNCYIILNLDESDIAYLILQNSYIKLIHDRSRIEYQLLMELNKLLG